MFLIGFFYIKRKVVWYLIFIYINWGFFGCFKIILLLLVVIRDILCIKGI